jgi:hypothetical protein
MRRWYEGINTSQGNKLNACPALACRGWGDTDDVGGSSSWSLSRMGDRSDNFMIGGCSCRPKRPYHFMQCCPRSVSSATVTKKDRYAPPKSRGSGQLLRYIDGPRGFRENSGPCRSRCLDASWIVVRERCGPLFVERLVLFSRFRRHSSARTRPDVCVDSSGPTPKTLLPMIGADSTPTSPTPDISPTTTSRTSLDLALILINIVSPLIPLFYSCRNDIHSRSNVVANP